MTDNKDSEKSNRIVVEFYKDPKVDDTFEPKGLVAQATQNYTKLESPQLRRQTIINAIKHLINNIMNDKQ